MTAVAGSFVKFDAVPTRKVVRITIEAPIEQADDILRNLGGYPDPANAKWVGIAPLKADPENTLKGGRLAQEAAILCSQGAFRQWAAKFGEYDGIAMLDADMAADFIREHCGVTTRAHLDHDESAAQIFREMKRTYEAWLKVAA